MFVYVYISISFLNVFYEGWEENGDCDKRGVGGGMMERRWILDL